VFSGGELLVAFFQASLVAGLPVLLLHQRRDDVPASPDGGEGANAESA
jgi:hypothetical protein